ncbi:DNA-3-methyladenine glycosylase I [Streptomyces spiralis]|uniref:DNA-3-methyladenine glycosylase I n=1 Tax=Streptomyces spiralis TaxID=66376 RepID=UPI0036C5DF8F
MYLLPTWCYFLWNLKIPVSRCPRSRGSFRPTTVFAFMQAMGLINDHARECTIRPQAQRIREEFDRSGRVAPGNGRSGS